MATEEEVLEHFQIMGIDLGGAVLQKCVDLCLEYNVDPETFVEQWMAFSLSSFNGEAPSLDNLNSLEKKEFSRKTLRSKDASVSRDNLHLPVANNRNERVHIDVISSYTPNASKHPVPTSDVSSDSQLLNQAGKYATRNNAGALLLSHGPQDLLTHMLTNQPAELLRIPVTEIPNELGTTLSRTAVFGSELLTDKAAILQQHAQDLVTKLLQKVGENETVPVRYKSQQAVWVGGRIACDGEGHLNPQSVQLLGGWEDSLGQAVALDLSNIPEYSIFPGQVVLAQGTNPTGSCFIAQRLLTDASQPPTDPAIDQSLANTSTVELLFACGPWTPADGLGFDALQDMAGVVARTRPHALIMAGPLLDKQHAMRDTVNVPYRSLYDKVLNGFLEQVQSSSPETRVVWVTSSREACGYPVYPTPPLAPRRCPANLLAVPDPALLDLGGVCVAVTATDVLMSLSKEELSQPWGAGDRAGRAASGVLGQACMWPLWPSVAVGADSALWADHAQLSSSPHLLLAPSSFRYFAKEINGTVVVNPERITKGSGGGTFARIAFRPNARPFASSLACNIVRI